MEKTSMYITSAPFRTENLSVPTNTRCRRRFTPRLLEIQRMKNTRCTAASHKAQRKHFVFSCIVPPFDCRGLLKFSQLCWWEHACTNTNEGFHSLQQSRYSGRLSFPLIYVEKLNSCGEFVLQWNRLSQNVCVFCCVGVSTCARTGLPHFCQCAADSWIMHLSFKERMKNSMRGRKWRRGWQL